MAQQGLAIALANGVLQGNLLLTEFGAPGGSGMKIKHCYMIGSVGDEVLKLQHPSTSETIITNQLYYDTKCAKPYITQSATVTSDYSSTADTLHVREKWTYRSLAGPVLGVFTAAASASDTDNGNTLTGLGTFRPTSSQSPISLGLTCLTKPASGSTSIWHCAGGIAQKFTDLKVSLGSVTPLTLLVHSSQSGDGFGKVSFTGTSAALRSSSSKPLAVALTHSHTLMLSGKSTKIGTDATKGAAGRFALFTPRPTGWTITDTHTHTAFSIAVTNSALDLAGRITDTRTNTRLATLSVDRSGNGSIRYAGSSKTTKIDSWILTG